ncbi:MAG: hypothetical protein HUK06_04030 [Bacteroidaceae bacterium]|nr:hypothetical protein [Bacteroidaceae bacterium]
MKSKIVVLFSFLTLVIACAETLEERAARDAKEFTEKNCPAPITRELTIDSMTFAPQSHTISYYYSLSPRYDISNLDKEKTKELLLTQLKNQTNLIKYKEAGYSFRYIYYELIKPEHRIIDVRFSPQDYNNR